jgi:SAM-dependent methyltransferase
MRNMSECFTRGRRYDVDMPHPSWNESYASGEPLPWDTGAPDPLLVEMIESRVIAPGRTLEIGCGTGTNAIFLAEHGFDVLGVDISEVAVDRARAKAHGRCRFDVIDFLVAGPTDGPFQFVFDRGCFHVFDDGNERARFAQKVAGELVEHGVWLSLIGSTEGAPRDEGPPRRSARDVMAAVEPAMEIVQFRSTEFSVYEKQLKSWLCLSRKRSVPAQPSTRR